MKYFKLIVFLFGIGISHCNNTSDLNISNTFVCDFDVDAMPYYAIVSYKEPLNPFTNNISNIIDLMFVFFIVCSSFACSVVLVSNYVYSNMINQFVTCYNSNKLLYEYDPYLFEYLDEFNNMKTSVLSEDFLNSLKYKFLKHNSPKGEIIMNYNHLYSSFDYYCKKSTIVGFNYLEVVSRIYVVNFDCKVIYSDNYNNLIMLYNKQNGILNSDENKEKCHGVNEGVCDGEDNVFFTKKVSSSKKVEHYNFVSNKYKYKGTLDDFDNYIKTNNLISIERSSIEDNNTSFFSLEKNSIVTECDELNISFKAFKSLSKVKTL